jgi:hypothetical protein
LLGLWRQPLAGGQRSAAAPRRDEPPSPPGPGHAPTLPCGARRPPLRAPPGPPFDSRPPASRHGPHPDHAGYPRPSTRRTVTVKSVEWWWEGGATAPGRGRRPQTRIRTSRPRARRRCRRRETVAGQPPAQGGRPTHRDRPAPSSLRGRPCGRGRRRRRRVTRPALAASGRASRGGGPGRTGRRGWEVPACGASRGVPERPWGDAVAGPAGGRRGPMETRSQWGRAAAWARELRLGRARPRVWRGGLGVRSVLVARTGDGVRWRSACPSAQLPITVCGKLTICECKVWGSGRRCSSRERCCTPK